MKLNISIDVDWLNEDGDIDEQMQEEIILGVQNAISKQCLSKVEKEASASIQDAMNVARSAIENKAINFVDEWLDKEATITDKWGDTIKTVSIRELVKQSFENLIEKNVDDDGRPTDYHGKPFIDWKINKMVEREVSSKMKDFSNIIDKKIKELIESKIKENVATRFAEMVIQTAKTNNLQIANK